MAAPTPPSTTRPPARRTSTATGPQTPQPGLNSRPAPTRPAASGLGLEGADRAARVLAAPADAPGHLHARAWAASSYDRNYGATSPGHRRRRPKTRRNDRRRRCPDRAAATTRRADEAVHEARFRSADQDRGHPPRARADRRRRLRDPARSRSRTGTLAADDASGRPQRRRVCCWRRRGNRQHRTRWQASW